MELINQQEEIRYRTSEGNKRTKEEILDYMLKSKLNALPEKWRCREFSDFQISPMKEVAEKLQQWNFQEPINAGIISQLNGIGKTHLATCVFKKYIFDNLAADFEKVVEIYNSGDETAMYRWIYGYNSGFDKIPIYRKKHLFLSEKKLAITIQESFNKNTRSDSHLDILESYCNLDFLVIDDCFSFKANEFARQNIFYIIDERCEWKNKPTFITSNLSLSEIADIDTRIADRIRNSMLFKVEEKVDSYRKKF